MMLTEAEVAERLRVSRGVVQRLRLSGRLPYLPGRPPRVAEADLSAFIEGETREAARKAGRKKRAPKAQVDVAGARARAHRTWLKRTMREGRRSEKRSGQP